ncbi:MAG: hypothetical protein PUB53_02905, partial [Bacteroidales bacterium]|nr:hypothetical protein [Bacteroidales bacterium]
DIYDHLRTILGHLRSPKRRTRIAVNGPQMRVDDATVCVRGVCRCTYTDIYDHSRTILGHLRSPKRRT